MDAVLRERPYDLAAWPAEAWKQPSGALDKGAYDKNARPTPPRFMAALDLRRILTNDDRQAGAARAAGFEAVLAAPTLRSRLLAGDAE